MLIFVYDARSNQVVITHDPWAKSLTSSEVATINKLEQSKLVAIKEINDKTLVKIKLS